MVPPTGKSGPPSEEKHRVVSPDEDCAPCRTKGVEGTEQSRCLEELDVEKIKKAVSKLSVSASEPTVSCVTDCKDLRGVPLFALINSPECR
jgi:hypothetical protein